MGLFSDTEEVVSASTTHLIMAGDDPIRDAVVESLASGSPLSETIVAGAISSLSVKMDRAMDYAESTYSLGLPSGEIPAAQVTASELIAAIKADTGYPNDIVLVEYSFVPMTHAISIFSHLASRGFNVDDKVTTVWPPEVTWVPIPDHNVDEFQRRVKIIGMAINEAGTHITVTYELQVYRWLRKKEKQDFTNGESNWSWEYSLYQDWWYNEVVSETIAIPNLANIEWNEMTWAVMYKTLDAQGAVVDPLNGWIYQPIKGTYPNLDPSVTPEPDTFLPVVPIRYDNKDYTDAAESGTDLYKTSSRLLKFFGLDYSSLGDSLNANPDVGDIDSAYVMFGVDLQTEFQPSLKYLFHFFEQRYLQQYPNEATFLSQAANPEWNTNHNQFRTKMRDKSYPDSFQELGLRLGIYFNFIRSTQYAGTIGEGDVGFVTKEFGSYEYDKTVRRSIAGDGEYDYEDQTYTMTDDVLILKMQISDNVIQELFIVNPYVVSGIWYDRNVTTQLWKVIDDPDEHNFIIPLQYNLCLDNFTSKERHTLYGDSCLMVINTWDKIKLEFYETGFFKFVIMVVAVAISVWTGGASTFLANMAAAIAAGAMAFIKFLVFTYLGYLMVDYATKWLVETLGADFMIIAVIAVAVAAVTLHYNPTMLSQMMSQLSMVTPQHLMQLSSSLISATNEFLIEEGEAIVAEYEDFKEGFDEAYQGLLDKIDDLLGTKHDFNPLIFARPTKFKVIASEGAEAFYRRSLGMAENSMYPIHDDIPNFYNKALTKNIDLPVVLKV